MKLSIYSIYDTVAQVFNKPFTDINNATAIRSFKASLQDEPHKNDYALYYLGDMFDHNGSIQPIKEPEKIYTGFDIKNNVVELPNSLQDQAK